MFINKTLIEKMGGFNEKYHMYYEDVDFCVRAEKKKYKSIYVNDCFIYHLISYSIVSSSLNSRRARFATCFTSSVVIAAILLLLHRH